MILQPVTAGSSDGVELMVLKMSELAAGCGKGVVELVVRIIHLIDAKDGFQAGFIEGAVVGNKGQTFDERLDLCPDLREDGGFFSVLATKAVDTGAPVVVVVGLGLDERVEGIYYLPTSHNDYTD